MNTHLFIATGNQSGSTLLQHLFALCKNVCSLTKQSSHGSYNIIEGQHLVTHFSPDLTKMDVGLIWTKAIGHIQDDKHYHWSRIRQSWMNTWRLHPNFNNDDRVFLEKSPANLGRVALLFKEFENAWFISQVRNPYAVAEGVKRRKGCDIREAGTHAIRLLQLCKRNLEQCDNVLVWRYEDLLTKTKIIEDLVNDSVPGIVDFSLKRSAPANSIDGHIDREIINLNDRQIASLAPKDIRILNEVFDKHSNLMSLFNYERIQYVP